MKKIIHGLLGAVLGLTAGAGAMTYISNKTIGERDKKIDKFKLYYNALNQWLNIKQCGKSIEKYFVENNYKTIAIYGMGEMGNRLYEDLKNSGVTVKYAIDKKADETFSEVEVLSLEDELPEVDVIVVSAIFAFEEIEKDITEVCNIPVVSLEDVLYDV